MRAEETIEIAELDLVDMTDDVGGMRCTVSVDVDFKWHPWLSLGTASLFSPERDRRLPWRLEARVADGTTDFEHSTCFVVRLPLLGVVYEFTNAGGSFFNGWIGTNPDDFRVATPDWNPGRLKDSSACERCKGKDKHRMCPQGSWMPPQTPELFERMKMRHVQIWIGPRRS